MPHGGEEDSGDLSNERALTELHQLVPDDPDLLRRVHFEVTEGEPAWKIVAAAREVNANLIVLGAREHSAIAEHSPWATLSGVIREFRCPVLAVPPHIA